MKKKPKHGGKRPGTGRPAPNGRKAAISVSLNPLTMAFLESKRVADPQKKDVMSRSDWIDKAIQLLPEFAIWNNSGK